jgi:hypothetical protein
MKLKYISIAVLSAVILLTGCKKDFLDKKSGTNASDQVVYSTLEGLQSVMNGVYRKLYTLDYDKPGFEGLHGKLFMYDSRTADVVFAKSSYIFMDQFLWYSGKNWTTTHQNWTFYYNIILNCNHVLDNVVKFSKSDAKTILEGQARGMRAMAYFYLIRLYQHSYAHLNYAPAGKQTPETAPGVILRTKVSSDAAPRSSVKACYDLILSDLNTAKTQLQGKAITNKSWISYNVVCGLLSRVYLEMTTPTTKTTTLPKVIANAKEARKGHALMSLDAYREGFNNLENTEWIWGVDVKKDQSDAYATLYDLIADNIPSISYAYKYQHYTTLDNRVYDKIPANDVRREMWVDDSYVHRMGNKQVKFLNKKDHESAHPFMRSAEMILNEAEAEYRLGNEGNAKTLLKELRDARNLTGAAAAISTTGDALLKEILMERRYELWGEGFRFFDIKRNDETMDRPVKDKTSLWFGAELEGLGDPGMWYLNKGDVLLNMQIPLREFEANKALDEVKDQNPEPRL